MLLLAVLGCRNKDYVYDTGEPVETATDADGDGFSVDEDCDDNDPAVRPDATEICNGIDDDCDELTDEDVGFEFFADGDADGFGAGAAVVECEAPEGYADNDDDCDDADPAVNPDADEICNGLDDDCDGAVDNDAVDAMTWYADVDGDGFGDGGAPVTTCDTPSGYVQDTSDCDDSDPDVNPDADEWCNGVDDDCDGTIDEDDALDAETWYADTDADGFGDADLSTQACDEPVGYVDDDTDCDDTGSDVYPGAIETCDDIDSDCDGDLNDVNALGCTDWYLDGDGDGYAGGTTSTCTCEAPSGYVEEGGDCDDADASVNPAATEFCDSIDNDCDGDTDEDDAADASTWYADSDGDSYGDASSTTTACDEPSGYASDSSDCDDTDADVNPGETEACTGIDDDCDGDVDEGLIGTGELCPGESCLDVLEEGTPTDSDWFWIDPGTGAYEEYCDYGTVSSGWSWKLELSVTNSTGSTLTNETVAIDLDTATLIAASKLEDTAEDLRFFTHDGPLLVYWVETCELDSSATTVWVTFEELATGSTDFTIAYGNSATERKSTAWWFDHFEADTSADYSLTYDSGWGTPSWTWDTSSGSAGPDSTNQDHWLVPSDLDLGSGDVYVEVEGWMHDDDALGVMMSDGTTWVSAVMSDDYNGASHSGGDESIVEHSGAPSAHYQGTQILDLHNITTASNAHGVGMYWDGTDHFYYLDGTDEGDVSSLSAVDEVGIAMFAAQGTPGAEIDWFWVGAEALDFDPTAISSSATASTGTESSF